MHLFFRKILFPRLRHAGGESGLTTPGNVSVLLSSLPFIQAKFLQSGLSRSCWGGGRAATRIGCRFDSQREKQHNITLNQQPLRNGFCLGIEPITFSLDGDFTLFLCFSFFFLNVWTFYLVNADRLAPRSVATAVIFTRGGENATVKAAAPFASRREVYF